VRRAARGRRRQLRLDPCELRRLRALLHHSTAQHSSFCCRKLIGGSVGREPLARLCISGPSQAGPRLIHVAAPHRIASHRIASHRIASHRIASHRIASRRVASHRIASHRIASHSMWRRLGLAVLREDVKVLRVDRQVLDAAHLQRAIRGRCSRGRCSVPQEEGAHQDAEAAARREVSFSWPAGCARGIRSAGSALATSAQKEK
jgi:hypothetical protein